MDLSFSPQEEQFRTGLRAWLELNLPDGWLSGHRCLPSGDHERDNFLRQWQGKLYEGGWAGISWPSDYGGRGASLVEQVIYDYEMVRVQAPPQLNLIGIQLVGPTLMEVGTSTHKENYLKKILSGEEVWCQGFSEPNAGSDLASLQTKAVRDGDNFVINGQKIWTSYARAADRCFLLARTTATNKKHFGITAFIVDMHQPGIEVRPIHQINEEHEFNELFFTDAVVASTDVVGEVDHGWEVALLMLSHERGLANRIFSVEQSFVDLVEFAGSRRNNGRALLDDELVADRLAQFYVRTQGSKLNFYRNLTNQIRSGTRGPEGSMDKYYSSELHKEMLNYAVSLLDSSVAMLDRAPAGEDWQTQFLTSIGWTVAGGTSDIQKNIVAERMLGLAKDSKS